MSEPILWEIPESWSWATIGEISQTQTGGTPSRTEPAYFGGTIPWVKSGELGDGMVFEAEESITERGLAESNAKRFPVGTLCIALYGATVGKLGILGIPAATNQAVCGIFLPNQVETRFAFRYLESIRQQLVDQGKGGAQSNISNGIVRSTPIPIAPLAEQRRIVAKIEELFSDLDAGVAALERARANLKRYRASVLKAAVEGELTADWRAQHPQTEPASALLQRILKERRAKWEADQLAKFAAAGKTPRKDWQQKYVEPTPPDTTGLPELPEGWCWASVEQVCDVRSGQTPTGIKDHIDSAGDVAWFKVGDMNHPSNQILMNEAQDFLTTASTLELSLHIHPAGTIIFPKRGGAIATNKKRRLAYPAAYDLNTMGLIPSPSVESFVWTWFLGVDLNRLSDGSNVPQINHHDIEPLSLPIPPVAEQMEIVGLVSERLSQIDAAEVAIIHGLQRAARLRQSILKQAFEGKLVPQDPTDEPASALLERIAGGKTGETVKPKRGRGKVRAE